MGDDAPAMPGWTFAGLSGLSSFRWLRQQREQLSGRWQGPIGVPTGSVVICLSVASPADDLATELLVRLLRNQSIDARHFSSAEIDTGLPRGADPEGVAIVYLVSAFPGPERERAESIAKQIREPFPHACLVKVFCPGVATLSELGERDGSADPMASSLVQALQICLSWQESCDKNSVSTLRRQRSWALAA